MKIMRVFYLGALGLCLWASSVTVAWSAERLTIGITLHPYYSFVSHIVGDRADVIPLIEAGNNPHGYIPQAKDIKRVLSFDLLVVNGIGHDEWAFEIVKAAGVADSLPLLFANEGVALIPVAADAGDAKVVNSHTFISTSASIQQIYTIARELGRIDPDNAEFYRNNGRRFATRIRRLKAEFMSQLADVDSAAFRCATMHGGYGYLMQEFGLAVAAVIEPRHGVQPSARQLADTIDKINAANVKVLFAEKYFTDKLSSTITEATGVEMFAFSHISGGAYTVDKYENEMRENLNTLAEAVRIALRAQAQG